MPFPRYKVSIWLVVTVMLLAGCAGEQTALNPAGLQAKRIGSLFWIYTGIGTTVYVLIAIVLLVALYRRKRKSDTEPEKPDQRAERGLRSAVLVSIGVTVVILFVLVFLEYLTVRRIHAMPSDPLAIQVTGHRWWWEVQYETPIPSERVTTANEIHVPIGRPVQVKLISQDVNHSLWIPNLHGKKDLIPGHPTSQWFIASRPGTYYGQCAEFCGYQHAKMRLVVVAEPEEEFNDWYAGQLAPASPPLTPSQRRGQEVFLGATCVMCHRISGTPANGRLGPDLTHVASREMLASGAIPNTRGHLAGWIVDPQMIKPGALMPPNSLNPENLRALLDYLQTLK